MRWCTAWLVLVLTAASVFASQNSARSTVAPTHDREFWRAIAKAKFAVPDGQAVYPLLKELSAYFGSKDSELRDTLAYSITTVWIKHQTAITSVELNSLVDEWLQNLRDGIGEEGTDSVLKRSFSALCLVALAERDLKMPFLGEQRFRKLLTSGLAYLKEERDLRGFDPILGWIHATAHTADLLSALAENSLLRVEDQARLLEAITLRLNSAHEIFTYGEQDRLARLAATIALRKDCDTAAFDRWLTAMDESDNRVWKDTPPKIDLLLGFENDTYMLRGLGLYLWTTSASNTVPTRDAITKILRER